MTLSRRWAIAIAVVLLVSLAGNLAAGGYFVGRWIERGFPWEKRERDVTRFFLRSVPEAGRPLVRERLKAREGDIKMRFQAVEEARRNLARTIRAPGVDRARIDAAYAELRDRIEDAQELTHEVMAAAILELPPEVRAAWQDRRRR